MSGHNHHHHPASSGLKIAFFLNFGFTALEFFGGWLSGSIAILSDAVHDLGDTASLGLALVLHRVATTAQPDERYTYGKHRWTLAGALANALVLVFGSALILRESIGRLQSPSEPQGFWMLAFAVLGITVNGYAAWRASRGKTLNEKLVSWHLLEDVVGWAAVLVASVVLLLTNWSWIDPVLAIAITLFILFNVLRRLREVASTFLQASPAELNLADLRRELEQLDGVDSIHHLHAWSLDGERHVISCHAVLPPGAGVAQYQIAKRQIRAILASSHSGHVTIELEFDTEDCSAREVD